MENKRDETPTHRKRAKA
jgi:hypothetical protein